MRRGPTRRLRVALDISRSIPLAREVSHDVAFIRADDDALCGTDWNGFQLLLSEHLVEQVFADPGMLPKNFRLRLQSLRFEVSGVGCKTAGACANQKRVAHSVHPWVVSPSRRFL